MKKKWGEYKILLQGKGFWVKKMDFDGGSTSLQTHKQRDELWLIFVPKGVKHKITARGNLTEIAIGNPKERDIKRWKEK